MDVDADIQMKEADEAAPVARAAEPLSSELQDPLADPLAEGGDADAVQMGRSYLH